MTPVLAYACPRCRGALILDEDGAWVCLLCGRPLNPPITLPKVMGDGNLGHRAMYAGQRKRPTRYEQRLKGGPRRAKRRSR